LKKLQEERQRIVEERAVEESKRKMEIDLEMELIKVQKELTGVLDTLIGTMDGLRNVITQNTDAIKPDVIIPEFKFNPGATQTMDNLTFSNSQLIIVQRKLVDATINLAKTMGHVEDPPSTTGGGGGFAGENLTAYLLSVKN
jgi:hypothetical protein